jgi:hypothetical protein
LYDLYLVDMGIGINEYSPFAHMHSKNPASYCFISSRYDFIFVTPISIMASSSSDDTPKRRVYGIPLADTHSSSICDPVLPRADSMVNGIGCIVPRWVADHNDGMAHHDQDRDLSASRDGKYAMACGQS